MVDYEWLYDILRKEKYNDLLQLLPVGFLKEVAIFLKELKNVSIDGEKSILGSNSSSKLYENSMALFKELILRRKKKILDLVFVATETGIMKRDYENMLPFEKRVFDSLIKGFEDGDKALFDLLYGESEDKVSGNSMILFVQDTEEFISMSGEAVGPFNLGDLANLDSEVSTLLVSSGKARYVDE